MAKKYLSLEEAAREAGVSVEELKQLRERGEIRGFSDGGTWKFKADDIEELKRTQQADSNPDVPLLTDEELEAGSSILGMEEEDLVSEQPTVIRGSNPLDDDDDDDPFLVGMSSDSDVQLIPNELLTDIGGSDLFSMGNSDSDVRLVDAGLTDPGSDSDVKLVGGSESDVKLVGGSDSDVLIVGGSDSDVRIMDDDSDSDVQLVPDDEPPKTEHDMPAMDMEEDSDSDVTLVPPPPGSGIALEVAGTDASVFDEDESGISLGDGSSITLAADSGISLEKVGSDSGLTKGRDNGAGADDDSDLHLATDDSGISLEGFDDSGISLMDDESDDFIGLAEDSGIELSPADSGIALESFEDSGIALDADDRTIPMMKQKANIEDRDDTAMDVPAMEDDSEFELTMNPGSDHDGTNVIMFDDEDEVDDRGATVVKKSGDVSAEFDLTGDADEFDLDESFDEFDSGDEFGADEFDEADGFEDDLDVVEDVVGEDDELDDLDVFDEGADDFDDDFDTGTSHPDFVERPPAWPPEPCPPPSRPIGAPARSLACCSPRC